MNSLAYFLNEAFSSSIIAELHKNNPETMNRFFRSLVKYRYSAQGLKDEFITEVSVADALRKNKSDKILKIWMKGNKIGFFTVAMSLIDDNFNWVGKNSPGKVDESNLIGDKDIVDAFMGGQKTATLGFTKVYMIAISSFKALGEKKQPTEVATVNDTVEKYKQSQHFSDLLSNDLPTDLKSSIISVYNKNKEVSETVEPKKGNIYCEYSYKTGELYLYQITKVKQRYYKDRWGVRHKACLPDVFGIEIDAFGLPRGGEKQLFLIHQSPIAKTLSAYKKKDWWMLYKENYDIWTIANFYCPSSKPSSNSSISTHDELKQMIFSDVPVVIGYTTNMTRRGYYFFTFFINKAFIDKSAITKDKLSKLFDKNGWKCFDNVSLLNGFDKVSESYMFNFAFEKFDDIDVMEKEFYNIFKSIVADSEYHTYFYETPDDSLKRQQEESVIAKEKEKAAEAAKIAAQKLKSAKLADIAKEYNKRTQPIRNKIEAQANAIKAEYEKIIEEILKNIYDNAKTFDDVINIWRKYMPIFNRLPKDFPMYVDDNIPVNTSGLYYTYERVGGVMNFQQPYGAPGMGGYKKSYYDTSFLRQEFDKWVVNKKPLSKEERFFLFVPIVFCCGGTNIISSGILPLCSKQFLFSTNDGKNKSGTIRLTFKEFMLAEDFFRTNSNCYTFK